MLSLLLICCNCYSLSPCNISQQVVLFPVLAGAFLNQFFQPIVKFVSPLMPPIAVITVAILCGNAIGQSSSAILASGGQVILATFLLQASGFFFGYLFARLLRLDVSSSRTISSQVGMKVKLVPLFELLYHSKYLIRTYYFPFS